MKKILILLAAVIFSATGAMAQTSSTRTIHGVVIDKNGNPIPGAEVMATGGAETTITDADGTFTLEIPRFLKRVTARYAGMEDKKLKPDFYGEMVFEMSSDKYGKPAWFVNVSQSIFYEEWTVDLMVGKFGNWGYFAKAGYDSADEYVFVSAGAVKRIYKPLYFYFGGGAVTDFYETPVPAVDLGLMLRLGKHFDISLDWRFALVDGLVPGIGFGVGYVF